MIIAERELKPLVLNPPPNITRVVDEVSEEKLIDFLNRTKETGFDVETTVTKDYFWRRLRTLQFGTAQEQYVVDLLAYCDNDSDLLYACQGSYGALLDNAPKFKNLISKLSKYLCSDEWIKIGVNIGFEYECLYWLCGLRTYGYYDCMLAEKCIYAGLGGHASLKNYEFYSMESMVERYFGLELNKTLQTSFDLESTLTDAQYEYAALDTRMPIAIRFLQTYIADGETTKSLKTKGKLKIAEHFYHLDSIIFGDKLHDIIAIENEAVGAFVDMHLHGERIDRERWKARVQKSKDKLVINLQELDKIFLPLVGSKLETISDEEISKLENQWKGIRDTKTEEEIELGLELSQLKRLAKKATNVDELTQFQSKIAEIETYINQLSQNRTDKKEVIKKQCSELGKKQTRIKKLADTCEGEALINYGSDAQLLKFLTNPENVVHFPKLFVKGNNRPVLESLDDDTLEKYENVPVIKLIREYHGLSKEIGTYGDAWATEWSTHPCKEEGWLHPGDGRLHSNFNQLDAGTGRSSSSQPNGQNLPQDVEVRSCFIADPPNENIRISNCCESDTVYQEPFEGFDIQGYYKCKKCGKVCETHAEEYVDVTADMSGAELRIIAEDANDPVWINAFVRGEDVHSVGTELLYEGEWPKEALPDCAYYKLKENGEPARQKCECPGHKKRRSENKSTNFLLAYGGGPSKLATEIKKSLKEAKHLMALHEMKNPAIWAYLDKSGKEAAMNYKAFDLFGRRRLLPEPTHARALENCQEYKEKQLRLPEADAQKNIETFVAIKGRKPKKYEEFELVHRQPTANEISNSYFQMQNSITRQGKNHRIQGTNATIAKKAMGAGYDLDGNPFLFHTLKQYRAKLVKFVHDELVVQCPKQYGKKVAELIGDAFKRAAALRMHKVVMEFDYHIEKFWSK